jgi:hypothetical protein
MDFARDNYYKECPAVMGYSQITDYRQSSAREEYIRNINNIESDHSYRDFLQKNASKIMDAEWNLLTKSYNCQPNVCIHTSPTRQPEGDQYKELKLYNDTRAGKVKPELVQCKKMPDYRMC